jgi:hypothetical protein
MTPFWGIFEEWDWLWAAGAEEDESDDEKE